MAAIVIVALACTFLVARSLPLLDDGVQDLRHVKMAMHDEELILTRVWAMVDRGDLHPRYGVYPGAYLYTVAAFRVLLGPDVPDPIHVQVLRSFSLLLTLLGLLVPLALFARIAGGALPAAVFLGFVALHPETVVWASRVHPDAMLLLFHHLSLALFALHLRSRDERTLYAASALAGLSAGTKLVGFFLMVLIGAYLVWRDHRDLRQLVRSLAIHGGIFLGLLVLTTPLLITHTHGTVEGWITQNRRNRHDGPGRLAWLNVLIGPRGLGLSGALLVTWGLGRIAWKPRRDLWVLAGFGLFFISYLAVSVSLALPRYAIPGLWPLAFVGVATARPSTFSSPRLGWAVAIALTGLFFLHDLPQRWHEIEADADHYRRHFSADKQAVAEVLQRAYLARPGVVVSSHAMYVPAPLPWDPVWWLFERDLVRAPGVTMVVVGPELRPNRSPGPWPTLEELGFALAQQIGPYGVYVRR